MQKETWSWNSARLSAPARLARWGHFGTPLLLFPTAGGDFEEVERFGLLQSVRGLVDAGRIKVFSVDGFAAKTWLRGTHSSAWCTEQQSLFEECLYEEMVPLIRRDCHSESIEIVTAGAAIGAFNAVTMLCRHPDVFRAAIALSGIFDLSRYVQGDCTASRSATPLHFLHTMDDGPQLDRLRSRFIQIATGEGAYEEPEHSRRLADTLSARAIPSHLDLWGHRYPHAWATWREMLPKYAQALTA